ncbi:Solute carrier family 2, facilitated glucose transporter member 3 [Aphelenchoides fujianensis]|nr:Solute carrier family 2, facilitated glucose transporter member 3 [Aphelenchoides fujianensis]
MDRQSTSVPYWSWRQTVKLTLIGCALSFITNFPSAFLHTSVNTAVASLDTYINESYIDREWQLEVHEHTMIKALVNNCWFAGQILGSLFSPWVCDSYGRKPAYLLATGVMTLACGIQALSTLFSYPEILVIGRTMASLFSPMSDAVAILYLQEISPTHLRGVLSSLFATGYSVMAFGGMVLGMDSVLGYSLTHLLFVPVIPGLLSLVLLLWLPETPKYLMISKKNVEGARRSLAFYQGDKVQNELILEEYQTEAKEENMSDARMSELFTVPYLRQAMILTFMVLTLCLPFYPILQSSTSFLILVGIPEDVSQWSSSFIGVGMIVGCLFAAGFLKRFQRRSLIMSFGIGSTLSVLLFAVCGAAVHEYPALRGGALVGMFGYIACWSLAVGPISYFIGPELVPIQHRSAMFCVCYALTNVLIFISNSAALALFRRFGAICFVPLFVIPSALALVYLYVYLPETKNKETHVIVAMLKAGSRKIHAVPEILDEKASI